MTNRKIKSSLLRSFFSTFESSTVTVSVRLWRRSRCVGSNPTSGSFIRAVDRRTHGARRIRDSRSVRVAFSSMRLWRVWQSTESWKFVSLMSIKIKCINSRLLSGEGKRGRRKWMRRNPHLFDRFLVLGLH